MIITANELKTDVSRYLDTVETEDIIVTKNGAGFARITHEGNDRVRLAKSLFGILPSTVTDEEIREERMKRYERID
jgi:antitoxin (DNA-binding transcriptional repressor) of toxin-antitoxin stability system